MQGMYSGQWEVYESLAWATAHTWLMRNGSPYFDAQGGIVYFPDAVSAQLHADMLNAEAECQS